MTAQGVKTYISRQFPLNYMAKKDIVISVVEKYNYIFELPNLWKIKLKPI